MAGKGGGAWKVAYADFVTAMMAFFMVMWLTSQNDEVKEAISRYFIAPVGISLTGTSKAPTSTGSLLDSKFSGQIPGASRRAAGRGLGGYPDPSEGEESETMVVAEWILEDSNMADQWKVEAREQLKRSQESAPVTQNEEATEAEARRQLAKQMRRKVTLDAFAESKGFSQDLVSTALNKVDWNALADECLREVNRQK